MLIDPRTKHLELPEAYHRDEAIAKVDIEERLLNIVLGKLAADAEELTETELSSENPDDVVNVTTS